jgi:DNA repair protein RadA/Sms
VSTKREKSARKRLLRPCHICRYPFDKDMLQCPSCNTWNTGEMSSDPANDGTVLLGDAKVAPLNQLQTGPWDPVFGTQRHAKKIVYGIVDVGVYLIGGAPGAGKSTLSLQLCRSILKATKKEILYLEAEESTEELKARAVRLQLTQKELDMIRVIPMGSTSDMASILMSRKPSGMIIDSLQGLCGTDLEAQVEFCKALKDYTVPGKFPAMVISHVTKEEGIAGLMALQHAVDMCALFTVYEDGVRELKGTKSRFGPCVERLFNMTELGLVERGEEEDDDEDE